MSIIIMAESLEPQINKELQNAMNAILSKKCCLCNNVLSVPPIMILSQDGAQSKCGRCKNNMDRPATFRNYTFENLAKFSSFPCIYKDCNKMIPWEEVENHEDACDKKMIKCPYYHFQSCKRNVELRKLEEHWKSHEMNIHLSTYNSILSIIGADSQLLIHENHLFITMILNEKDVLKIYVASLKKINTCFTYNLKLSSTRSDDIFVIYVNQKIDKYNEMDHCFTCLYYRYLYSRCGLRGYPHTKRQGSMYVDDDFKKIDLAVLKPLLGELSKIKVDITIVSKNEYKDNNKASDTATVDIPKNDVNIVDECLEKFKKQLQCPICMEYMIGKIYNCEKGHVLCDTCKLQLTECPSCRANLGESRSFPLESLADEVVLACVFSKNDCKFTGKLKLLSPHEKECVHK
ncbi:unnamed protein product [Phaedon cochleariae]|uniref:RING-type domain-containing protein n=1 Tax=Phaedon cochleariae TaxID=80249 RepID=A0A9P0DN34_PHACE|nr:unnamed protein product [Phaedon cochleariae]